MIDNAATKLSRFLVHLHDVDVLMSSASITKVPENLFMKINTSDVVD